MRTAVSLLLVVLFLAMNAFFVIAEFALVRVRKSQLDLAVEKNIPGATNARLIAEDINKYLSACQLGITLASLALGWLGEPAFAELLRPAFAFLGLPEAAVSAAAVALGFIIMTALHVVVGELIPKSFAIFSTEKYALATSTALLWFYRITYPVMVVFNGITNGVVKLFGHDPADEREVYTEEEIQLLIDESTESGLIDPEQNEYVDNIFDLGDKDVESIMTPRVDITCLDVNDPFDESLQTIIEHKFTRYPVCDGSKDRIVGFAHVKDLYLAAIAATDGHAESVTAGRLKIRPIEAVPESMSVTQLIQLFQDKHTKIAVVADEHGGTAGIVTMSDIMDEIVGPSDDEYHHGNIEQVRRRVDGSYEIDGVLPIDDLKALIGFLPDESDEYETAAGLMLLLFTRIPETGETTAIADGKRRVRFTILERDRLRVEKILVEIEDLTANEAEHTQNAENDK